MSPTTPAEQRTKSCCSSDQPGWFIAIGFLFALTAPSVAQLPTATGQQISLSQPQWKLFIPSDYQHRADDQVDLLVHFHGDPQTVWNNVAYADLNSVVLTVNYSGLSSAYSTPFSNTSLFQTLLNDARSTLAAQNDFDNALDWDRLTVSSFSAGYGAVRQVLGVPGYREAIDHLVAADSLYASTAGDGTAVDSQMVGYKAFADLAAAGQKQFIFSHSLVETYTYESTRETGDEILAHLGISATPTNANLLGPLQLYREASAGGFQLWGAAGAAGEDHLNHLRYLGEWLDDLSFEPDVLPGDFNRDGAVNAADYTVWMDNFLAFEDNHPADANGDGFVGNVDYDIWAANYGLTTPPPPRSIPEPSGLMVAVASLFAISWRRFSPPWRTHT